MLAHATFTGAAVVTGEKDASDNQDEEHVKVVAIYGYAMLTWSGVDAP